MPWSGTAHLRSMVGNQNTLEMISFQDLQDANHVDIAVVDKGFFVIWDFSGHVAEVDVGEFALFAELVNRLIEIAFGHFGERTEAKLKRVGLAGMQIDET